MKRTLIHADTVIMSQQTEIIQQAVLQGKKLKERKN